ncbi:unnamed protein product [Caenorhabditis auriculariae]|uniref:Uncharacterized protein n=1 Tax=Caenorhabditis auriculariae TaxID=2777116 RepID=A0A8S1HS66_9PELO|nr:unnamed protein product [Caenorhabditis auriculariae]
MASRVKVPPAGFLSGGKRLAAVAATEVFFLLSALSPGPACPLALSLRFTLSPLPESADSPVSASTILTPCHEVFGLFP